MSLIFCYSSEHIDRLICHLFPWYHKKVRNSYHIVCQIRSFSYTWRSEKVKKWDSFRLPVALISYKHKLRKCFVTYLHILIFSPYFCEIFSHCVLMRYAAQWAIEHTCMSIIIVLKFLYPEAMKRWTKSEFPIS